MLNQPFADALKLYVKDEYFSGHWSSVTTYNNLKYTVKLVSRFFGKKKVNAVKKRDIRNWADEYVKTHS
ncbi:hypothetical protein [Lactobacillus bombicola]|uniref:Uncharacterized protein n=1 Tax=Lactobacillus bombicola TaxID=1505723 RepID=A0A396SV42_9LACO|nr:hypothetical protein [Lactobacillus bombicola]RHW55314.1 hypothetical protein DS835_00155 [Lactobacillus bombicola]